MARRKQALATAVALGIVAAAEAGCYWPIPSCHEDADVALSVSIDRRQLAPTAGASFVVDGKTYASCMELCAAQSGVRRVVSCQPPAPGETLGDGSSSWTIACRVDQESCEDPILLDMGSGRRPEGLAAALERPATAGAWLAELARLEAASVPAFDRLARELAFHGAPPELVHAARRAQADEVRHTRMASRLARRFGVEPLPALVGELAVRSLVDVAIENAVEGCVTETIGAALAAFQARAARDPHVRRVMVCIERDETEHAVLAWKVLSWTLAHLERADQLRVIAALREAAARLDPRALVPDSAEVRAPLGLPHPAQAAELLRVASARLFAFASRKPLAPARDVRGGAKSVRDCDRDASPGEKPSTPSQMRVPL